MIEEGVGHQAAAGVHFRAAAAARAAPLAARAAAASAAVSAEGGGAAAPPELRAAASAGLFVGGDHAAVRATEHKGTGEGARDDEARKKGAHQRIPKIIVENAQS